MKKYFSFVLASALVSLTVVTSAFAAEAPVAPVVQEDCAFEVPEDKFYDSTVVAVRKKLQVSEDEAFRVKVFLKNTGNMPWFSGDSSCMGPHMSLGTDKTRDRDALFYDDDLTGWESENRVGMDQLRTNPGEIASFTFWGMADNEGIFKEYFTPVLEGIMWLDEDTFSYKLSVGDHGENTANMRDKFMYAGHSGEVSGLNLLGEKMLLIDRSDQTLTLLLGGKEVRQFRVSTGAPSTPTPLGDTKISLKQQVRVGNSPPHYIMPKFMWFRAGGYGFHALPSLETDNGTFWTEALDHIGIPVSHGCVRLLPQDADFLFEFTELGTTVRVQQ
ncbi:L,D-transpeptidase [Candidatus Gracilibacteria bacterium]|nr:L,D-transpeptidase [Candidatus Gracilibacteria bacterium]